MAQARVAPALPHLEVLLVAAHDFDLQVVLKLAEEAAVVQQQRPVGIVRLEQDLLHHDVAPLELLHHDAARGLAHVVGGIHAGVGGRDDGEQVVPVPHVLSRVPHLQPHGGVLLQRLEHHGRGPVPLGVHLEKAREQHAGAGLGVQLAHARDEDGPVDAAQEAADVGVDAAALRPQLDGAQRGAKVRDLLRRHQPQDHVRHARAVQAAHAAVVAVAQRADVADVQLVAHHGHVELGVQQVDLHARVLHLDDGHVGVAHRMQVRHRGVLPQHLLQAVRLGPEKVGLASPVARPHAQRVDVAAWPVHPQAVRAKGEDARVGGRLVPKAVVGRHAPDPILHQPVELAQHLLPQQALRIRLIQPLLFQVAQQARRLLQVHRRGRRR
mmetsp:Transcript_2535/g.6285  ORF Transcript_2535/g.6285 Transcript_2535/m.6285 type:complete len:382 (+) Transcript_2535:1099-2244(+)